MKLNWYFNYNFTVSTISNYREPGNGFTKNLISLRNDDTMSPNNDISATKHNDYGLAGRLN